MTRALFCMLGILVAGCILLAAPAGATVWSAVTDFSATNGNPNGVWTYGYKDPGGGLTLTAFPDGYSDVWEMGYMQWQDTAHTSVFDHRGWIMCNPTPSPYTTGWGVYFAANGINMHPGNAGQQTTIRWTSPVEGWVKVTAEWTIHNYWGAPTGYVEFNGEPLYTAPMLGCGIPGQEQSDPNGLYPYKDSYIGKMEVQADDVIDISVDWGPDSYWGGDATGIVFTVETTSPPSFISGVVRSNLPGNTGIGGVTVETTTGGFSTKTDATGHYRLLVDPGTYSVLYSRSDCVTQQKNGIVVLDASTTIVDVTLTTTKTSWNAATDYSTGVNPGFDWTYGYRPLDFSGSLTPYDVSNNVGAFELYEWSSSDATSRGWISYNANATALEVPWGIWWDPHGINMHPGELGDRPTLRWTSPMSGWVDVAAAFKGMDPGGTTSDCHILVNDDRIWDGVIHGYAGIPGTGQNRFGPQPEISHSFTVWVNERDTIDCSGGFGINANWGADATAVSLSITPSATPHASISGVVRSDAPGNPPLAGVKVKTVTGGYATTTNVNGQYWLAPAPGTYTLEFSKPGFKVYQTGEVHLSQNEFKTASATLTGLWSSTDLHPAGDHARSAVWGMAGDLMVGRVAVGGVDHAALWKLGVSGWTDLHPAAGFASSLAYGVSGTQVAGGGQSSSDSENHALIWDTGSMAYTDIHPSGYTASMALACQGGSQAGYVEDSSGVIRAAKWDSSAAGVVDLTPALATDSYAGAAYGGMQGGFANVLDFTTFENVPHAGLWSGTAESWLDLHPEGATISQVNAMDSSSQGGYTGTFAEVHAALWRGSSQTWVDLNPAGVPGSQVYAVFGNTQVGSVTTVNGATHAALWTGTAGSMVELNDFLPAGFTYSVARGVYVAGDETWIAGFARTDPADINTERAVLWGVAKAVQVSRISDLTEGAFVTISGKTAVCSGSAFTDGFYMEEPDRSSGIRVAGAAGAGTVQEGDSVTVTGTVKSDAAGQLFIDASSVSRASGVQLQALGVNNRDLDSTKTVLVTVWGRVTAIDAGRTFFYVDDGSSVSDGGSATGVRIDCAKLTAPLTSQIDALEIGDFVVVTGIAAKTADATTVRPRAGADIR